MRTWSVSGTAFALCTRSSSLSINTSTSMAIQSTPGGSGLPVGEQLPEPAGHRLGDESVHLTAEVGYLLHAAGGNEAHLGARHHVDRFDLRRERPVEVVHLELPLEVGDDPQ